jgi:UDP-N-acetylglucosamine 1-carboxyvinyltransferase
MDRILVRGGKKLEGRVRISGAKNAALPIMAAAMICDEPVVLRGIPALLDIDGMEHLLCSMGVLVERKPGVILIDPRTLRWPEAPYDLVRKMRASFFVLGPLIARCGRARVSLPGGCAIGSRPVDIHIKALQAIGINISVEHGCVDAWVGDEGRPVAQRVTLDFPSVGATENLLSAAVRAKGTTVIHNAACEPEVSDLANFLVAMGAKIEGIGTPRIEVEGVDRLRGGEYEIIPDRIEAGTYLVAGAITGGHVILENACSVIDDDYVEKLTETGCENQSQGQRDFASRPSSSQSGEGYFHHALSGFPHRYAGADDGAGVDRRRHDGGSGETIFVTASCTSASMSRLGANIQLEGNTAIVARGGETEFLPDYGFDLRASAALVLAGLVAEGEDRSAARLSHRPGYEKIEEKTSALGANIRRVSRAIRRARRRGRSIAFQAISEPYLSPWEREAGRTLPLCPFATLQSSYYS